MDGDVGGVGDELALGVEEGAGEVEAFFDVDGVAGVLEGDAHFIGDGLKQVVENLQEYRVWGRDGRWGGFWGGRLACRGDDALGLVFDYRGVLSSRLLPSSISPSSLRNSGLYSRGRWEGNCCLLQNQVIALCQGGGPSRLDHVGSSCFNDQGWPCNGVSRTQIGPLVDRGGVPSALAIEVYGGGGGQGGGSAGGEPGIF